MEMLLGIIGLFLLCLIIYFSKSDARIKGEIGEKEVRKRLKKLRKDKYTVFNDITFSINGKLSQIDHLVVSNYGIFVIETKNYKGLISGKENDYNWIQFIGRYKNHFYNPIRQNQGHIFALRYVLKGFNMSEMNSIIVFTKRATLKVSTKTAVIPPNQLLKEIKSKKELIITDEVKDKLIERIKEECIWRKRIRVKLKKAS